MREHSVAAKTSDAEVSGEEEGKKRDEKKIKKLGIVIWMGGKRTEKNQKDPKCRKGRKGPKGPKGPKD